MLRGELTDIRESLTRSVGVSAVIGAGSGVIVGVAAITICVVPYEGLVGTLWMSPGGGVMLGVVAGFVGGALGFTAGVFQGALAFGTAGWAAKRHTLFWTFVLRLMTVLVVCNVTLVALACVLLFHAAGEGIADAAPAVMAGVCTALAIIAFGIVHRDDWPSPMAPLVVDITSQSVQCEPVTMVQYLDLDQGFTGDDNATAQVFIGEQVTSVVAATPRHEDVRSRSWFHRRDREVPELHRETR